MAVKNFEISKRYAFARGVEYGEVGSYEVLEGKARLAFGPEDPANSIITDIGLAPRDDNGHVQCLSDFRVLRPTDARRGNGRGLVDIVNRGGGVTPRFFNDATTTDPAAPLASGNGFLMRRGYTIVQCGWQYDLPDGRGLLRLEAPEALLPDGSRVSGKIHFTFHPDAPSKVQSLTQELSRSVALLPRDIGDPEAVLTVRDRESDAPEIIPHDQWMFARQELGNVVPDHTNIYLKSGFVPGKVYQATYMVTGAQISGLGLLAVRDVASFIKYGSAQEGNPCADNVKTAYAFGISQTGRFLRLFLYLGLNIDERERRVFDGVISHIGGGRRAEFSSRFPQASSLSKRTASYLFPFTDVEETDPGSGETKGLLSRQRAKGGLPKVFFTNTSAEYYGSMGSLVHTDVEGSQDVASSEDVRIYVFSGTHHSPEGLPLGDSGTGGTNVRHPVNIVDYRPLVRAALVNLDRWVSDGVEPPSSRHPRIDERTLVWPERIAAVLDAIPGVEYPKHLRRLKPSDYAPGLDAGRARAIDGGEPLATGIGFTNQVAAVDDDGNEVGGIRLPDVSVPLATHTGWNMRHPEVGGAERMMGLIGSSIPFCVTREQRQRSGDPRESIQERYASKEEFLEKVGKATRKLVEERFLLEEDVETVLEHASQRYDLFCDRTG